MMNFTTIYGQFCYHLRIFTHFARSKSKSHYNEQIADSTRKFLEEIRCISSIAVAFIGSIIRIGIQHWFHYEIIITCFKSIFYCIQFASPFPIVIDIRYPLSSDIPETWNKRSSRCK